MRVFGGLHWSFTNRAWCGLFVPLSDQRVLIRHELTWIRTTPEMAAKELKAFCASKNYQLGYVVADPHLFPKPKGLGETVSETFSRSGIPMLKGDADRINGWSRVRSWLQPATMLDGSLSPSLLIHADCKYLIRTLPTLVSATENPDDVDETPDEYPAKGVLYYVMSRPMPKLMDTPALPPDAIGHWVNELRQEAAMSY